MPCRHIRAGVAYLIASLFRAEDEEGYWLVKKKS
jgi:hypothetical protein